MTRVEAHLHIRRFLNGSPDCISVRPLPNLQVHYAGTLVLTDVTFAVQASGLRKFKETGQKNVHAFVRGTLLDENGIQEPPKIRRLYREAYYNPKVTSTFVDKQTGNPLYSAKAAYLVGNKVYYVPEGS